MVRCVFRSRLAPARRCATHRDHPPGAAHRHAGAQPRARPLRATHWTNRLPRQTSALFTMADTKHSARPIRNLQVCKPENAYSGNIQNLALIPSGGLTTKNPETGPCETYSHSRLFWL